MFILGNSPKPSLASSQKQFNYVRLPNYDSTTNTDRASVSSSAAFVDKLLIDISPTSNHTVEFPSRSEGRNHVPISPLVSIIDMPIEEGMYS